MNKGDTEMTDAGDMEIVTATNGPAEAASSSGAANGDSNGPMTSDERMEEDVPDGDLFVSVELEDQVVPHTEKSAVMEPRKAAQKREVQRGPQHFDISSPTTSPKCKKNKRTGGG